MVSQKEHPEIQVFKTVLVYCVVIIAFPVIAFFASKVFLFEGLFGWTGTSSDIYSAGIAICILHVALGAFIYKAYFDGQPKLQTKAD